MVKLKNHLKQYSKNGKLFLVNSFISFFTMSAFSILLGIFLKEKQYGEAFVGSIMSIQIIAMGIGSLPSVFMLNHWGSRRSLILSLLLIAIGGVGQVVTNHEIMIIIYSILYGVGFGIQFTVEPLFLTENSSPVERMSLFSLNFVLKNIAMMIGNFSTGYISDYLKQHMSSVEAIRWILVGCSFLTLTGIYAVLKMEESTMKEKQTHNSFLAGYREMMNLPVVLYLLYNALIGLGAGMVVPFFSVYLKYSLHVDDMMVGSILSFAQLGTVLGGMLISTLARKIGKPQSVVLCQMLSIPFLLSIAFPQGLMMVAVSFFMRSSLMNMAQPVLQNLSMDLVQKESRASFSSFLALSNNILRGSGVYLGGIIMERFTYNTPYYFTVSMYFMGTILFMMIFMKDQLWKVKKQFQKQS
ncbi:MFS family permease [Anaerosolibacter carboniphilus]|uniref:MFS family permease n=1 Tax=Anaerosolibacter carboniphilus TaxID=1417629 RepID=A0A841KR96_9FIRM|nr:MFS transporter [Anaerosolibacter carboniphilus]MBB6214658.1 MFS family permease [Anaerosolibacter carboniphilus]